MGLAGRPAAASGAASAAGSAVVGYPTEMPEVLAALPRIRDQVEPMISHRYPFVQVLDALKVAGTPASAKVMIDF